MSRARRAPSGAFSAISEVSVSERTRLRASHSCSDCRGPERCGADTEHDPHGSRSTDSRKYQTVRILLATSMVPDAGGIGAMPKLFDAQRPALRDRQHGTLG